jgi:hypothetical protein
MLPSDQKALKEKQSKVQSNLDSHLQELPPKPRVIKYSNQAFKLVALEWLIATDQVLSLSFHYLLTFCSLFITVAYQRSPTPKIQRDD